MINFSSRRDAGAVRPDLAEWIVCKFDLSELSPFAVVTTLVMTSSLSLVTSPVSAARSGVGTLLAPLYATRTERSKRHLVSLTQDIVDAEASGLPDLVV